MTRALVSLIDMLTLALRSGPALAGRPNHPCPARCATRHYRKLSPILTRRGEGYQSGTGPLTSPECGRLRHSGRQPQRESSLSPRACSDSRYPFPPCLRTVGWVDLTRRDFGYGLLPYRRRSGPPYNRLRAPAEAEGFVPEPGCGPSRKQRGNPPRQPWRRRLVICGPPAVLCGNAPK